MKRPMKITLGVAAAVLVLLVAGAAVLLARLDGIVKQTVEREGTAQLRLATALDDADVSLLGGTVTLDGLTIANPEGYAAPNLFELGQVSVAAGVGDLTDDPVRVRRITVNSPSLTIERASVGDLADQLRLNLQDLLDNLETDPEAETTKLIIDELTVSRARVSIRPNLPELKEEYALTLPDVTLRGIGTADEARNGAEIGRVTADVAMALARKALASEDLPPEVRAVLAGDLRGVLNEFGGKLKDEVREELNEQLGDVLGDDAGRAIDAALEGDADAVGRAVGDRAKDEIGRGLGNLLGGGKKDEESDKPGETAD